MPGIAGARAKALFSTKQRRSPVEINARNSLVRILVVRILIDEEAAAT